MKRVMMAALVVCLGAAMTVHASVIVNPTGWSNEGGTIDYNFDPTIDNSGLSSGLNTGDAVPATLPGHVIPGDANGGGGSSVFEGVAGRFTNTDSGTATLTFDLGTTYTLDSCILWNGAEYWYGFYNGRGLAGATLSFSTDGVTFGGDMTISPARIADSLDPFAPEVYAIADVDARYVKLSGLSNHDGSYAHTAISEIKFTATAIPEPATMSLLGLGTLGLLKRRRK